MKIALGTDAAVYPHGQNGHELEVYVRDLGMKPLEAIQTATVNAADLLNWSDRAGSIDTGKFADLIAVDGNPLESIKLVQDVKFVMKAGVVYKGAGAKE